MQIQAVLFDMYETLCSHYRCPLYFGAQMADDFGIARETFLPLWRNPAWEEARTLGLMTLEELLRIVLPQCGITEPDRLNRLIADACRKRSETKRQCLHRLHPGILPMLWNLKARGIKLGLISNCYEEEAMVIRRWPEGRCFDTMTLSCEEGVRKPDPEIYRRCMERLGVSAQECLFIGDGGSHELEAARSLGMTALQAAWYIHGVEGHPSCLQKEFPRLDRPEDVIGYVR